MIVEGSPSLVTVYDAQLKKMLAYIAIVITAFGAQLAILFQDNLTEFSPVWVIVIMSAMLCFTQMYGIVSVAAKFEEIVRLEGRLQISSLYPTLHTSYCGRIIDWTFKHALNDSKADGSNIRSAAIDVVACAGVIASGTLLAVVLSRVVAVKLFETDALWGFLVESVAVLAGIAVIIGIPVLIWQVREDRLARYLEGTVSIFAIIDRPGFRELRRFVYNDLPQDPEQVKSNPVHLVKAEMVMVLFNELAMMWKLRMIHRELVLRMYSDSVVRAWEKLKPLIYKARDDRNDPDYGGPFEELCKEATKYRKMKGYTDLKHFQRPEVTLSELGEKPSE